ncbi:MAG: ABC transporter permease [Brooklawnia sp.]|jgi:NitT/TauT family transport system permease protein
MAQLRHNSPLWVRVLAPLAAGLLIVIGWQTLAASGTISPSLLPAPGTVADRLASDLAAGRLWEPTLVTIQEAMLGCVLAASLALPIAYLIAHLRLAQATFSPYLAASQAIPSVALAPLLVIWVGYGTLPVVILCSIMVFFPMVLSTVLGLRSIDREVLDAARVDGASRAQLARWIEWPLALPATLTGLRNGFTLSVTGAVVGELVMGGDGLGQRLAVQSQSSDTTGLFVTLLVLCAMAIAIFLSVTFIEWLVNPFASRPRWRFSAGRRQQKEIHHVQFDAPRTARRGADARVGRLRVTPGHARPKPHQRRNGRRVPIESTEIDHRADLCA